MLSRKGDTGPISHAVAGGRFSPLPFLPGVVVGGRVLSLDELPLRWSRGLRRGWQRPGAIAGSRCGRQPTAASRSGSGDAVEDSVRADEATMPGAVSGATSVSTCKA
jgi:hypothetical protein